MISNLTRRLRVNSARNYTIPYNEIIMNDFQVETHQLTRTDDRCQPLLFCARGYSAGRRGSGHDYSVRSFYTLGDCCGALRLRGQVVLNF